MTGLFDLSYKLEVTICRDNSARIINTSDIVKLDKDGHKAERSPLAQQ